MAEYDIIKQEVVDEWGDGEGRAEVQAVYDKDHDYYCVRVCYYQDNGRFGQSAPTIDPDQETADRVTDAFQRMAKTAREERERARFSELSDLVEEVGYDRAKKILEREATD